MEIQVDSEDKNILEPILLANIGNTIAFWNGCWLSLVEDNGVFWGETPYGTTWACNAYQATTGCILEWLRFWDEPRDERGDLIGLTS